MSFIKSYLHYIYNQAMIINDQNVCLALKGSSGGGYSLLDIGCWDGEKTLKYAQSAWATEIYGIEIVPEKAKEAEQKWIKTFALVADREKWPFEDESLDYIVSNQVIEHLSDVDHFISEATRVLKKWGVLVTSTNNLSSWHNIFALLLGWAPFDLTNSSTRAIGIWNPLALHSGETTLNGDSWTHKTIFTTRWLNDWFKLYWLESIKDYGSWYYPFPTGFGKFFKKHSAFITLVNKKWK